MPVGCQLWRQLSEFITGRAVVVRVARAVAGVALVGVGITVAAKASRFAVLSDAKTLVVIVVIAAGVVLTAIGVVLIWCALSPADQTRRNLQVR